MIAILLLAAGRSSRMRGGDKLLERIDDGPLLAVLVDRARATGPVIVTVPSADHPRCRVLPQETTVVAVQGEMSDSIRAGLAAVPDGAQGVIILPADMPDVTADDIKTIAQTAAATGAPIVRATSEDGTPGHPIYFARATFPDFDRLTGDRGARSVCAAWADRTEFVALPDHHARLDLDTPEDWDRYRRRR